MADDGSRLLATPPLAAGSQLTTSDAAYLASASSLPPPLLARPLRKASASQAKGQKSSPSLLVDLTESSSSSSSVHRLHLSPSPSRPRSFVSSVTGGTEEGLGDIASLAVDDDDESRFGAVAIESHEEQSPARGRRVPRTDFLSQRLRSAIGQDIVLQKAQSGEDGEDAAADGEGQEEGTPEGQAGRQVGGQAEGQTEEHTAGHAVVEADRKPSNNGGTDDGKQSLREAGTGSGWGWSTFATLPSALRVETALSNFRGAVSSSSSSGTSTKPPLPQAQEVTTREREGSLGSYMKPLDVRRWWTPATTAGGDSLQNAPSERASVASTSNGTPVSSCKDSQSVKSVDSALPKAAGPSAQSNPLRGLTPGSFPASSIGSRNKKARALAATESEGKERSTRTEVEVVEHDLTGHRFGVQGSDGDEYPEREYLVLSTAGKPIYVSYISRARLKRAEEAKQRRLLRRSRGELQGPTEAEETQQTTEDQALQDDEDQKAATKVGVLQALVSNYETLGPHQLQQRSLDILELPSGSRIYYLLKPPLYLVAISQWGEEESTLRNHLEHLHLAIISLVSASKLSRLFDRAANFDLKRLLEGTDGILDCLLTSLQGDATALYGALQPLRIDTALRLDVGSALIPSKDKVRPQDALYALLLTQSGIVTLARRKRRSIHPVDCHLLINTVYATKAMKEVGTQSWVPICLPKFAPQGFLYAHVSFLEEEDGDDDNGQLVQSVDVPRPEVALVLVTSNPDGFDEMSTWRSSILGSLQSQGLLARLRRAVAPDRAGYSADELRLPGLRHFVFKWRSNVQSTSPQFEEPYEVDSANHKRLICLYGMANHYIYHRASEEQDEQPTDSQAAMSSPPSPRSSTSSATAPRNRTGDNKSDHPPRPASPTIITPKSVLAPTPRKKTPPTGQHLLRTHSEIVFAWSTPPFELYLTVSPHLPRNAIISMAKSIVKWVKQEEHRLFIVSAPVF